jgi:hypothetical protein
MDARDYAMSRYFVFSLLMIFLIWPQGEGGRLKLAHAWRILTGRPEHPIPHLAPRIAAAADV